MVVWTLRKFSAVALGTGAGMAAYAYQKIVREPANKTVAYASWTNSDRPVDPWAIWDRNWDCREPKALVKPMKNDSPQEQNRFNAELEKHKVSASRHIILVRHGEYLDEGESDATHRLTERGRLQAKYTGKRLQEMGIQWDKVIASTMTRAKETNDIILKEIGYSPDKVQYCDFLREGAPIPPQPPVGHWRPEKSVCLH